jgi:hypothetical protein
VEEAVEVPLAETAHRAAALVEILTLLGQQFCQAKEITVGNQTLQAVKERAVAVAVLAR